MASSTSPSSHIWISGGADETGNGVTTTFTYAETGILESMAPVIPFESITDPMECAGRFRAAVASEGEWLYVTGGDESFVGTGYRVNLGLPGGITHAPAPAAGCVYIECLDSIPLHGDRPVDRQQLLTTIVHSYLRFIKSQGFRSVHIRVPPPSAENSHIFAYRSLKIRMEATLRMAQWFKRLLDSAVQLGVINSFEGESHLSKLESFPPCILPAADIAEEHAFSAMRSTAAKLCESGDQEGVDASVLQRLVSFKERFFVAHLTSEDSPSPHRLEPDESPLHPCPVVSRRRDLIAAFARERLSFTTPESAKFATRFILCRLAAFAQSGAPMPPAGCGLDDKMPDWVHRQQQLPTLDDSAMDFDEYSASHKNEGMDSEGASKQTCIPTAGEPHMSSRLKMEDGPGVVITSSRGDNLLLDGAELVRGSLDGVLEPLGDLDDAELFADSLFSA